MKRALLVAGAATTLGIAGLTGITAAHAATSTSSSDPMSSLVNKIAEKFNLKTADVQAVFDQQHQEMDAKRDQAFKDKLAAAVKDGKLTQAQSDKITAKVAELKAAREANKDKTDAERKAAMKTEFEALKQWAKDNGIDMTYLRPEDGMRHGPRLDDN